MRCTLRIVLGTAAALGLVACGGDDGGGPCGTPCGAGYVCDEARGICVGLADAGTDGDVVDAPPDTPAETPAETDGPAETPAEGTADDARTEVLGPCADAGGTCRGLVAGCASCPAGEEPAPTTIRCPPDNFCCMTRTAMPPLPACLEAGGVCYPISSGSECPTGWVRDDLSCGGPGGCCMPGDGCV